ncbi:MAG: spore germination protein, partial [Clostridia bacterium]
AVFTVPEQTMQISLLRLIFLFLGGMLGIYGIVAGGLYIVNYLNAIDSFGAPYLAPVSPYIKSDMKDALLKTQLSKMNLRPKALRVKNKVRQRDER